MLGLDFSAHVFYHVRFVTTRLPRNDLQFYTQVINKRLIFNDRHPRNKFPEEPRRLRLNVRSVYYPKPETPFVLCGDVKSDEKSTPSLNNNKNNTIVFYIINPADEADAECALGNPNAHRTITPLVCLSARSSSGYRLSSVLRSHAEFARTSTECAVGISSDSSGN